MSSVRQLGLLLILAVLPGQLVAQQPSPSPAALRLRPLLPSDVLRLDDIGQVTLSPDGLVLAYVLRKSATSVIENSSKNSEYSNTEEIWIASTRGGEPQKITDRLGSGIIFTQVMFSPDSHKLAFVSVKNWVGSLWVCDLTSKQLKLLADGKVNYGSVFERTVAWVSNQDLMYSLSAGPKPPFLSIREHTETATQNWMEARKGRLPTRSVVDSGLNDPYQSRNKGTLCLINVLTGDPQVVSSGDFNDIQVSPDRRYVAVLKQIGFHRPKANEALKHPSAQKYGFTVVTTSGKLIADALRVDDVIPRSFSWSPDSSHLALAARSDIPDRPVQIFVFKPSEEKLTPIRSEEFSPVAGVFQAPPEMVWTTRNELLVLGRRISPNTAASAGGGAERTRSDWWILNANGLERNLTEKLKLAPPRLISERNGESFLGVADGELWRITATENTPENLTRGFDPKVSSIAWPRQASPPTRNLTKVVLSVNSGNEVELYTFELNPGGFKPLTVSLSSPTLRDYSAAAGVGVFTTDDRTGTYLSIAGSSSLEAREIVAANTFLRGVAEGSVKKIQYRGLDGQDLVGWLILPINYVEGSRYPLVVRVYAGTIYGDSRPEIAKINESHPLNLQLLASHGYAVLLPSMPLKPSPESGDPFMELTKGVLPAVDKVIEMNVADPQRVGLIGQSFGGYSTYGLLAQTSRFKAAVSMAGVSNLISLYGQFNATDRYSNAPHDNSFHMSWAESGQGRLGNPPWKDVGRYIRNSPLFYVERVQTPLLIIQGDMDYVAMQQGEEFFTALYRQNKRARFVRYWGEAHVIGNNPANVTDMWEQIFAWFDTYLGGGSTRSQQP